MKWLHLELSASHVTKLSRHNYHVLVTESIKDNFINKRDVGSGGDNDDGDGGKSMYYTHTHTLRSIMRANKSCYDKTSFRAMMTMTMTMVVVTVMMFNFFFIFQAHISVLHVHSA